MDKEKTLIIRSYVFHNCTVNPETRNLISELLWVYPDYSNKEDGKTYTNLTSTDNSNIITTEISKEPQQKSEIFFMTSLLNKNIERRNASYKNKYIFDKCCGDLEIEHCIPRNGFDDPIVDGICEIHGKEFQDIKFKFRTVDTYQILNDFRTPGV